MKIRLSLHGVVTIMHLVCVYGTILGMSKEEILSAMQALPTPEQVSNRKSPFETTATTTTQPTDPLISEENDLIEEKEEEKESEEILDETETPEPETGDFNEEEIGIQGNWVKKKDWLTRSYELSNKIRNLLLEIRDTRNLFQEKYSALDDKLDSFYKELGLDQGKLQQLFDGLKKFLEKKKILKLVLSLN